MTIFTDRDLERVESLRVNWRKEFLLEVVRLRQQREIDGKADRVPSTAASRASASAGRAAATRPRRKP